MFQSRNYWHMQYGYHVLSSDCHLENDRTMQLQYPEYSQTFIQIKAELLHLPNVKIARK